ncbi:MAG: DNA polymerase III subunit delta, partial [Anaerolineae bacterium]|nr:DNA polymerase III subunit delta [Anaerolineae bacterium]
MSETAPTVYLLHGNDEFAMREFVQSLEGKVNDDRAMALMDIVKVDGRTIGEDELRSAAYTIPFLNLRRLVVLTSPTARVDGKDKASRQRFLDLLSDLPSSTALVLVLDDQLERGRWKERARNQWLFDWAANAGGQCLQKDFTLPVSGEMAGWLVREARKMGGEISPPAANLLASHTGSDTRRAMLELEKLLIYVDYQRKVESDDVKALAIPDEQVNVFQLVDAMTAAEGSAALASLHKLLDDEEPLMISGMVTRQFRLLLLARAVIDAGG